MRGVIADVRDADVLTVRVLDHPGHERGVIVGDAAQGKLLEGHDLGCPRPPALRLCDLEEGAFAPHAHEHLAGKITGTLRFPHRGLSPAALFLGRFHGRLHRAGLLVDVDFPGLFPDTERPGAALVQHFIFQLADGKGKLDGGPLERFRHAFGFQREGAVFRVLFRLSPHVILDLLQVDGAGHGLFL